MVVARIWSAHTALFPATTMKVRRSQTLDVAAKHWLSQTDALIYGPTVGASLTT